MINSFLVHGADTNHDGVIDHHDHDLNGDGIVTTHEYHTILQKIGVTAHPGTVAAKHQMAKVIEQAQQAGKITGIDIPQGRSMGWHLFKLKLISDGHDVETATKIAAKVKQNLYGGK